MNDSLLQTVLREAWSWVIRIAPAPWRGSIAALFLLCLLFLLFRRIAPWGLIGLMHLTRGAVRLLREILLRVEGRISNQATKSGSQPSQLLTSFSEITDRLVHRVDRVTDSSLVRLRGIKARRSKPRLVWLLLAVAIFPTIDYTILHGKQRFSDTSVYQFARRGLAWWHSCEHYLLSGGFPTPSSDDACVQHRFKHKVKPGESLKKIADRYGIRYEEIILDNPESFPPLLTKLTTRTQPPGSAISEPSSSPNPPGSPLPSNPTPSLRPSNINNLQPGLELKIPLREPASLVRDNDYR